MINQHLQQLAHKFPQTKFIKSQAQLCIPNYPDRNLPTVFVYLEGDLKTQHIGPAQFGTNAISLQGWWNEYLSIMFLHYVHLHDYCIV